MCVRPGVSLTQHPPFTPVSLCACVQCAWCLRVVWRAKPFVSSCVSLLGLLQCMRPRMTAVVACINVTRTGKRARVGAKSDARRSRSARQPTSHAGAGHQTTGDGDLCRNAMQTARMTGLWLALGSSVVAFDGLVGWRCFQPLPRCVPRPDARPSISFHGCRRHPSRFLLRLTHRRRSPTVLRARRECF